jgi:hypothetical protein
MIHLDLTDEEKTVLAETLKSYLADLRVEISNTDLMDFREQLKAKKDVLNKILGAIEPGDQ